MIYKNLTEQQLQQLAAQIAKTVKPGSIVYLQGPLGAGKTTFVRAFLRALGCQDHIKSPTFTMVESYEIDHKPIYHFDFYRLHDISELEHIGLDDYFTQDSICLIEWPEKVEAALPSATLCCTISMAEKENCRDVTIIKE